MQKQGRENKYQTNDCCFLLSFLFFLKWGWYEISLCSSGKKGFSSAGWSKKMLFCRFFIPLNSKRAQHTREQRNNHLVIQLVPLFFASFKRNFWCNRNRKIKEVESRTKYCDEWLSTDLNALFNDDEKTWLPFLFFSFFFSFSQVDMMFWSWLLRYGCRKSQSHQP